MVGDKTFKTFSLLGVNTVSLVQEMPVELMVSVIGKNGRKIWERFNGIDDSPVKPFLMRKSISSERTYGKNTSDQILLHTTITAMAENLSYQLRRGNKLTSTITVKIRYSDFQTYSKQIKLKYTSADHIIIPAVLDLFKKLYNHRVLVRFSRSTIFRSS